MAISKPILFITDSNISTLVKAELKAQGAGEPSEMKGVDPCIEALVLHQHSLLVLDMSIGSEKVNQILTASKTHFVVETRPILLFINDLSDASLALATEYNISQIHAGDPQRETIGACIRQLIHEETSTQHLRELMLKVSTARGRGDWAIVTPLLQRELEKNPADERLALELAENYIHERNWAGASLLLEPFLLLSPPMIRALNLKARCLMHEGQFAEAATCMEKAKLLNPHNVDRLIEFGHVLISADRVSEAQEQFEEAAELDSTNDEAAHGVGQCMLMQGEVNEALDFLKSISGPRELASIFNSAAVMSIHNSHFEKGMKLYQKAFSVIGDDEKIASRLMFNMGLGYKKNNQLGKAKACFEKSVKMDPEYNKAGQQVHAIDKLIAAGHPEAGKAGVAGTPVTPVEKPDANAAYADHSDEFAEEDFVAGKNVAGK